MVTVNLTPEQMFNTLSTLGNMWTHRMAELYMVVTSLEGPTTYLPYLTGK